MNELRRHIMMQQGGGGILPPAYQQVEYLDTTGNCYFQLQIPSYDELYIKITASRNDENMHILGIRSNMMILYSEKTAQMVFYSGNWGLARVIYTTPIDSDIEILFTRKNSTYSYLYINGTLITDNIYSPALYTMEEYRILYSFWIGTVGYWEGRFKNTIYRNEGLDVVNLIPCYRKSDNVAGVYDIANDVFHTNAGTGTFIVGPDV